MGFGRLLKRDERVTGGPAWHSSAIRPTQSSHNTNSKMHIPRCLASLRWLGSLAGLGFNFSLDNKGIFN